MNVEDYCYIKNARKYGIGKIYSIEDNNNVIISFKDRTHMASIGNVVSSQNIISLIRVGDYVNGMLVTNIWVDDETGNIELEFNKNISYLYVKNWGYQSRVSRYLIKSIVTKEMFSQIEYRVGG